MRRHKAWCVLVGAIANAHSSLVAEGCDLHGWSPAISLRGSAVGARLELAACRARRRVPRSATTEGAAECRRAPAARARVRSALS